MRRVDCWLLITLLFWAGGERCRGQGHAPANAAQRMKVVDGLQVKLVAAEPLIAQPVCIEFDARGRLWVIQYLQYPNPAGLKRAKVDRWSRTIYEQVPEPPPRGPKGADRITILEDKDHDGVADGARDFVNGLNLATGLAFGHGGVFVLQVPYLLFYPDRDGDDAPDSDPIVCLSGFGMEDAHSVANSLTWGPDGWLYGCQGSTVTANIRGIEFQQGVWRYHPLTREFELFCEGGGNSWGLDFDDEGELIYSTNLGPYRNLHGIQGAYYWKSFGKHGALHNPYAFGYFDHIPHTNFTGGHVTDGGRIYYGTNLPARFRGRYICGDLLGHGVQWHELYPWGSTFTSSHGGYLLEGNDTWFAPTDLTFSPDGAVYVTDWHDRRTAHPDPDADWDRSNGRIYRLAMAPAGPVSLPTLTHLPTAQLIGMLRANHPWLRHQARRVLADRRDPEAVLPLRALVLETPDEALALQALWALYVSGGFNERFAAAALGHRVAAVRKWTVRLLGDEKRVSAEIAERMQRLAQGEPDVHVRAQLAASAQRLSASNAFPIISHLLLRDEDRSDPYLPLLLWWAVEKQAIEAMPQWGRFFGSDAAWKSTLARETIVGRLLRRWIAEGTAAAFDHCAGVLKSAPGEQRPTLLTAVDQGFQDRPQGKVTFGSGGLFSKTAEPAALESRPAGGVNASETFKTQIAGWWNEQAKDAALIRVAARVGVAGALVRARMLVLDPETKEALALPLIALLGETGDDSDEKRLVQVAVQGAGSRQLAALDALQARPSAVPAAELMQAYSKLSPAVRARVRQLLLARKESARWLLSEVDAGRVPAAEVSVEQLRLVALHEDSALNELVRKNWGSISRGTAEEKLAEMRRLNNDLNAGPGDRGRGQGLFERACAVCHQFLGQGKNVGPDLTHANRSDREFLLGSLVDPSAAIRKEYLAYDVETTDGRVLSGLIAEQNSGSLTLLTTGAERVVIPQGQVATIRESSLSLMPENLLKTLTPQEVRDLFNYLQQ